MTSASIFRSSNGAWYWQHPATLLTYGPFPTSRMALKDYLRAALVIP